MKTLHARQTRINVKVWPPSEAKVVWFLLIGGTLFLLGALLLEYFTKHLQLDSGRAYLYSTLITYVLQFSLNAVLTWSDRKATFTQNLTRVGMYVPIKLVLWSLNQGVFSFWLLLGWHYHIANAFSVLLIMTVNYFVFDRLIFKIKEGT